MKPTQHQFTVQLPIDVTPEDARLAMALRLFEKGRISLGWAARMTGNSKRDFIDILAREGIPVCNYTAEDLAEELAATARRQSPREQ